MFSVMAPPRHIAPSPAVPISLAPAAPSQHPSPTISPTPQPSSLPVAANDVIFVGEQAFNGRGYQVCGVRNQRGRNCGRIGVCPFHSKKPSGSAKRPRPSSDNAPASEGVSPRQMAIPPHKTKFKRSWTPEEHKLFLKAMQRHGKGKWKEIAVEVKTRTANQCQSHAQKYFLRQAKTDEQRKKKSIHDITAEDVSVDVDPCTTWNVAPSQPVLQPKPSAPGVSIAPRKVENGSAADATSGNPEGVATSLNLTEASGLMNWSSNNSASPGITSPIATSSVEVQTRATGGVNSMSVITNSSGVPTVPVVFPMTSVGMQYAAMVPQFMNSGNGSMAAVIAPPPQAKVRVTINVNGRSGGGKALLLPGNLQELQEFFQLAERKLGVTGALSRVFTRSGAEISNVDEICHEDVLWLSRGEEFLTPR